MPRAKNEHTIFAYTKGVCDPDPNDLGVLTVEPIFPGSCQAKRQGYRWVCRTTSGDLVFVPFRSFVVLEAPDSKKPLTTPNCDVN